MMQSICTVAIFFLLQISLVTILPSNASSQVPDQSNSKRQVTSAGVFNQEVQSGDSAGIRKYSFDLIHLLIPEGLRQENLDHFSDRLASAEEDSRQGHNKLVSEESIANAFNHLTTRIGSSAMKSTPDNIHEFRKHAAELGLYSSLLTFQKNTDKCNPGEAIFLLNQLITSNGILSDRTLDYFAITEKRARSPQPDLRNSTIAKIGSPYINDAKFIIFCTKNPPPVVTHVLNELFNELHI